jgi:ParB family chromosome partitioning protein
VEGGEREVGPAADIEAMEIEFHRLDRKYAELRIMDRKGQAHLVASVVEHGQQSPVLVVEGEKDRYVLIDGYRRVAALEQLGRDTVDALLLPVGELEALCLCHRQERSRHRSALEEGWFCRELAQGHGLNQLQLAEKLGRSSSWVSRRLALVQQLPNAVQKSVRRGQICPYGAMRYLVPLARAKETDCIGLVKHLGGRRLSARDLGRLYVGWRAGDRKQRQRIIEQPFLYLKAEQETRRPDAPVDKGPEALRGDIEALGAISRRACKRVVKVKDVTGLGAAIVIKDLHSVWAQTKLAFAELQNKLEERFDVG